jgi:hypothetical protein
LAKIAVRGGIHSFGGETTGWRSGMSINEIYNQIIIYNFS